MESNKSADRSEMSPLIYARVAGILYLSLIPLGIFIMYVPSTLIIPGDIVKTANNIIASETLFRIKIVVAIFLQLVNIILVLVLYKLLKPASRNQALLMVIFFLVSVPITMVNELNSFAVLLLLSGGDFLAKFPADQLYAQVKIFLDLHHNGVLISGVFWGLWLFPMGYLVFKSGFLPKIIGVLLMIGCFGYLIDSFATFLFPDFIDIAMYTFWGEILLPLWLVVKGVNVKEWEKCSLESLNS